jgi:hypothetical protein
MVGEEEKVWPFVDPGKKRKKLRIWSRLWQDTEMMRAAAGKNENKEKWGMRFGPTRCAAVVVVRARTYYTFTGEYNLRFPTQK